MSFNYNINNYTKEDLIEIFGLPPNYDINIVNIKETKLRDSILNNTQINKETQIKTLQFLVQAKTMLLNNSLVTSDTTASHLNSTKQKIKNLDNKIEKIYHLEHNLEPSLIQSKTEHMVQERPYDPYIISNPTEYVEGVINPLKRRVIKKNLNIDTRFRENYYTSSSTNFNFNMPLLFNNVMTMQLSAIELPTTFYNVSKQYNNNYFTIIVDGVSTVVSIGDGSYSYDGITTAINAALFTLGLSDIVFSINITKLGDGNNGSGQMLVELSETSTIKELSLNFQANNLGFDDRNTPLPLKLGWILGFRNGIYENSLKYVSEGVVDVTGSRYLYLVVDDHNNSVNNGFYSAFNSSMLNNNILARISLNNTGSFSVLAENNFNIVTTAREYFGPVNIQQFGIQLLDEYGRVVDLNNMDFSFCLTLTTVYDI